MQTDDSSTLRASSAPEPRHAKAGEAGRLYFEDLHVGRRFKSVARRLDADAIKTFAREFDPQPFHTDEATAQDTFFAGLAASGWHTAAVSMRLLVESLPIAGGLIGAGVELSWPIPTRPGDTLTVESEVIEMRTSRSRPERGLVRMHSVTRNQNGEVVQDLTSTMVVPRRG